MLQIMGKAQATVRQMQKYILKVNPAVPASVTEMIHFYLSEGDEEGVRGDVAFAQSCLETGNFTFRGSAVTLAQNNFCGLGVTNNGMTGSSFASPQIGIRAQIQHLQAYASNQALNGKCVDSRYIYVKRACSPFVEWLGMQENPEGAGWAAGKDYGKKIIAILDNILSIEDIAKAKEKERKEEKHMTVNKAYISNNNSYATNDPRYIVIHCTDNFAAGANALAHAKAQYNGNLQGTSVHYYVDDGSVAYQTLPYNRGPWHVGVNYGGRLFGVVHNRNSIGIEMCVQAGYNYEKAFQNTVALCRQVMAELNINADHVVTHFDVCAKNCPSAIRARDDWERFKELIGGGYADQVPMYENEPEKVDELYRVRTSWADSKSQIGAFRNLDNAIAVCRSGYKVFDWDGKVVYKPAEDVKNASAEEHEGRETPFLVKVSISNLNVRTGPGIGYTRVQYIPAGIYTITEVRTGTGSDMGWGKLKSGMGWIALDHVQRL